MQILKLATNTILYFDSMDYPLDTAILDEVQRFIRHRLDSKTTWTVAVQNVEKQKNSDDCGVFVCMFAMRYTLNTTFTHLDIPYIRQWMAFKIIKEYRSDHL
jgi:Ulp1 family protease